MRIPRVSRLMPRVVDTLTSVAMMMIIICAGTSAPIKTPAAVAVPHWIETVPRTAAHHTGTTVVMNITSMADPLTVAAPPARLSANQKYVPAMSHLPTSATTPSSTAEN